VNVLGSHRSDNHLEAPLQFPPLAQPCLDEIRKPSLPYDPFARPARHRLSTPGSHRLVDFYQTAVVEQR
jgi:hypothetical protein